ncbi:MAG: epoxyqueuosine reductase QueH [Candidatus Omnitrophica bacterium]|nr:epoxyqueuosine reductase QueH [Candidatus Omnitrophota bacterium]
MSIANSGLKLPEDRNRLLLHSCCAPCSCEIMEALVESKINFTVFFYNPNIYPQQEYALRKNENIRFAEKLHVPFVDGDYDADEWLLRVKGLEALPEKQERCLVCFDMRLEATAKFAQENGFDVIASSLGISRWKDLDQVNKAGIKAALKYPGMIYWAYNWRKNGGSQRMEEIAQREEFYRQKYCGCIYSLNNRKIIYDTIRK